MKSLQRFFLLFLCLVLLLGVFSVTANAAEFEGEDVSFYGQMRYTSDGGVDTSHTVNWVRGDGSQNYRGFTQSISGNKGKNVNVAMETYIKRKSGDPLFLAGQKGTITILDVWNIFEVSFNGTTKSTHIPTSLSAFIIYVDGSVEYISTVKYNKGDIYDIKLSIDAEKDIKQICYTSVFNFPSIYSWINYIADCTVFVGFGEGRNDIDHKVIIELTDPLVDQQQQTNDKLDDANDKLEEANNKLEEMLESLFNGFNDLSDKTEKGFAGLGEKIKEVFNAITNLPAKIWEFIENGLKNLFVPDEEFMVSYKEKWSDLLADKLGAVYQVTEIIFGAWDDVRNADQTNTINLPVVTIPLPQNNSFSFGGYDVKIVPDGFESAVELVKVAIGIVCTFMFINGVRRRYDEIMGVNE